MTLICPNHILFHVGYLTATGCTLSGHGGSALVHIAYSGCVEKLHFASSALSTTECH